MYAALVGLLLFAASCATPPSPPPTAAPGDDFAVVRQRAEERYQAGRRHLQRGELEAALVSLDQARVNDPDNRQDIKQALDETLQRLRDRPPTPTSTSAPPAATPATLPPATQPALSAPTPAPSAAPAADSTAALARWSDPQGRFSLLAPPHWQARLNPSAPFGTGLVALRDPNTGAEVLVAEDARNTAVSPELYAAKMELALRDTPGYALQGVVPGSTAGTASIRRSFLATQRDGSGADAPIRGYQVVLLQGATPWILTASAPADRFEQVAPALDRVLRSFSFG